MIILFFRQNDKRGKKKHPPPLKKSKKSNWPKHFNSAFACRCAVLFLFPFWNLHCIIFFVCVCVDQEIKNEEEKNVKNVFGLIENSGTDGWGNKFADFFPAPLAWPLSRVCASSYHTQKAIRINEFSLIKYLLIKKKQCCIYHKMLRLAAYCSIRHGIFSHNFWKEIFENP